MESGGPFVQITDLARTLIYRRVRDRVAAAAPRVRDRVAAAETASPDDRPHRDRVAKARLAAPMDVGPAAHDVHDQAHHQQRRAVGDDQHRLEPAKYPVGAPVAHQLHRGSFELPLVGGELLFEPCQQCERVGGPAGESGDESWDGHYPEYPDIGIQDWHQKHGLLETD